MACNPGDLHINTALTEGKPRPMKRKKGKVRKARKPDNNPPVKVRIKTSSSGRKSKGDHVRHYPKGHPKAGQWMPSHVSEAQVMREIAQADTERLRAGHKRLKQQAIARGVSWGAIGVAGALTGKKVAGGYIGGHARTQGGLLNT